MKVLGIVCSPRFEGNTQILVEEALKSARELGMDTELYLVAGKSMSPCDGCRFCVESGDCCIQDDMQGLYRKLLEADGIIIGSPVYYWTVSAQAKIVIDRTYAFRRKRRLRGKVGGALVVAGRRGLTSALAVINGFFEAHQLTIAGGGTALAIEKGDVRRDQWGIKDARRVGSDVATLLKARQAAEPGQ